MAGLPPKRIMSVQPPFTNVGVGDFGPLMVKKGQGLIKRYGVLFTCLATRAILIEVLQNSEADSFINVLRRSIARRGKPDDIRSDNGTNFKGENRELIVSILEWNQSKKMHIFLLQHEINWLFNPPAASHKVRNSFLVVHYLGPDMLGTNKNHEETFREQWHVAKEKIFRVHCC